MVLGAQMTALLIIGVALPGLVSIAGFIVLMLIHAKVDAYHRLRGDGPPAP
jgi:uncharacterized membrane protein YbaN (DUF454 family)